MQWKHRVRPEQFTVAPNRPATPPPQAVTWWWNPGRLGVYTGPSWFTKQLEEIDPNLAVTWDNYNKLWLVWMKKDTLHHKLCHGWMLLFTSETLDPLIFHRLYSASQRRWGSAKKYFDAIEREMAEAKAKSEATYHDNLMQEANDWFNHSQIRVGYGPSSGSKFSKFLS